MGLPHHHRAVNLLGHKLDQHGVTQLGGGEHLQYLHLTLCLLFQNIIYLYRKWLMPMSLISDIDFIIVDVLKIL